MGLSKRSTMIAFIALCSLLGVESSPSHTCPPSISPGDPRAVSYVSDNEQCDKFYLCDDRGELAAELLCEDGLVFDVISKQCGLPHGIDCSRRPRLQEPQPEGNCERANGKWAVKGSCVSYTDCTRGEESYLPEPFGIRREDWAVRAS